jgi:hypothetical protein
MGRAEVAGSNTETIRESTYADGQTRHGINPDNVHRRSSVAYDDPGAEAYRRDLGNTPHPDAKR